MASDRWHERLEAYLDGELDRVEAAAFEAETAADPTLAAELRERRAFRDDARRALNGGLPADLDALARGLGRRPVAPENPRRDRRWQLAALAAVLALAILAPTVLRNDHGAEGPRSTITAAGQVVAVRYGERPDATATLQTGWHELPAGLSR